jgi:uncharacterized protein (TIGR03437 family)
LGLANSSQSAQWASADFNGPNAPTNLDGISVSIKNKPAYVWYLSPTQLNVQAPEDSTNGNVAITVTTDSPIPSSCGGLLETLGSRLRS